MILGDGSFIYVSVKFQIMDWRFLLLLLLEFYRSKRSQRTRPQWNKSADKSLPKQKGREKSATDPLSGMQFVKSIDHCGRFYHALSDQPNSGRHPLSLHTDDSLRGIYYFSK